LMMGCAGARCGIPRAVRASLRASWSCVIPLPPMLDQRGDMGGQQRATRSR
jgi:hypothetical protein